MKTTVYASLAALCVAMSFAGSVWATEPANDAMAVNKTKVSLSQAITLAEQSLQGKATKAELEQEHNALVYEVEVVSKNQVSDVRVDSMNGKILSSTKDTADHDADREKED